MDGIELAFLHPAFWVLWSCGGLGILLWLVGTKLAKNDPRVSGSFLEGLQATSASIFYAALAHTFFAMGLWAYPMRGTSAWHPVFYAVSGAFAQTCVAKIMGAIGAKLHFGEGPQALTFDKETAPPPTEERKDE